MHCLWHQMSSHSPSMTQKSLNSHIGLALFDRRTGFLRAGISFWSPQLFPTRAQPGIIYTSHLSMPQSAATYIGFWQVASASDSNNCLSSLSECQVAVEMLSH
ncbi:unnamed protein product [Polarella glacialis]|uniref:Uncharacterized protein n=1 Tax=Polarella glacialis TaxID=89957 RepID=A0A813HGU6_POLGL|nr:unnamed protein product [Polarella glacialis]